VSWVKVHEPGLSAAARALHPLRLAAAATREPDGRHAGGQFFRDAETGSRKRHDTPVVTLSAPKNVEETFAYIDRQFSARTNPRAFVSSLHGKSMLDPVPPCIVSPVSLSLSLSLCLSSAEAPFIPSAFPDLTTCLQEDSQARRYHRYGAHTSLACPSNRPSLSFASTDLCVNRENQRRRTTGEMGG